MGTSVEMIDRTYRHLAPDAEEYERGLLDAFDSAATELQAEDSGLTRAFRPDMTSPTLASVKLAPETLSHLLGTEDGPQEGPTLTEVAGNRPKPTPGLEPGDPFITREPTSGFRRLEAAS
jgi:hypothetical protein